MKDDDRFAELRPHFDLSYKINDNLKLRLRNEYRIFELNNNIPQIGRAFLEDVTLNYTPNEKSAFFHDGVPCQIGINLKFSQAILLNRQLVLAGF